MNKSQLVSFFVRRRQSRDRLRNCIKKREKVKEHSLCVRSYTQNVLKSIKYEG